MQTLYCTNLSCPSPKHTIPGSPGKDNCWPMVRFPFSTLPLDMLLPLLVLVPEELVIVPLSMEVSPPPSNGEMWFKETCSMKDVPYFLKYHHSKICEQSKIKIKINHFKCSKLYCISICLACETRQIWQASESNKRHKIGKWSLSG